ncbi:MAG: hypothetical protein QM579_13225 [Desulfovibrio sp.]|uniref:hypothetical protein n=1 Tax=Desulfovibrio sp. TaxID=885 RepID=UPI0039E24CFB
MLPNLFTPADRRLMEEVRARDEHPYARIRHWQARRLLTIIDKLAAERRTGVAS